MDRTLARGLFLLVISLAFGLQSLRYPIGQFSRAGAGLFPLMISSLLLLIALITLVRSRFVKEREQMDFNAKNIGLIMLSLCGFALVSHFINMIAGIAFMVFVSAFAGQTYSTSC
jgi:Tripartite tricarboxylate transporter TctB family